MFSSSRTMRSYFGGLVRHASIISREAGQGASAARVSRGRARGGGGFALALAGVNDEQALLAGLGGQHLVAGDLAVARLFIGAAEIVVPLRALAHDTASTMGARRSRKTACAELDSGFHKSRSCASIRSESISLSASGLCARRNSRTL